MEVRVLAVGGRSLYQRGPVVELLWGLDGCLWMESVGGGWPRGRAGGRWRTGDDVLGSEHDGRDAVGGSERVDACELAVAERRLCLPLLDAERRHCVGNTS